MSRNQPESSTMAGDRMMKRQWLEGRERVAVWIGGAALMLLPILAIRAGEGSAAEVGDFVFLAILLAGLGGAYELAIRVSRERAFLAGTGIALAAAMLQAWINLAVGVIGTEDNPANLIYAAVLAVALGGAVAARFRPTGMARAMLAAAAIQLLAFLVALVAGLGFTGPITIFFTGLWLIAAGLFHKAAEGVAA